MSTTATPTTEQLFFDLWQLLNEIIIETGDMVWLTDGASAHCWKTFSFGRRRRVGCAKNLHAKTMTKLAAHNGEWLTMPNSWGG